MCLTLFRPRAWWGGGGGGLGRILPAATLHANNVLNIRANATKLGDFFLKLSGNNLIGHISVHMTWRFQGNQYFDRHVF